MAADFPKSHKDPAYDAFDARTSEKLGLPPGLLAAVRTRGERTDHGRVSSAGAETPYQIIPATRKAAIDKYGIDPMLSPENASEVAGRLLKDSLERNKGDASLAVAEYIGGTDRSNWGPVTRSYVKRVVGRDAPGAPAAPSAQPSTPPAAGGSTFQRALAAQRAAAPAQAPQIAAVYQAYQSGQMSPEDAAEFEADVKSGTVLLPRGAELKATPPAGKASAMPLPEGVAVAYLQRTMAPEDRAQLDQDIAAGLVQAPQAAAIPTGGNLQAPAAVNPIRPDVPTTLGDKIVGTGEAALQVATGAVGVPVGAVLGGSGQLVQAIRDGSFGTPQAADLVEKAAMRGAQALTYAPRTASGQDQAEAVGAALQQVPPVIPVIGPVGAAAANTRMLAQAPRAAITQAAAPAVAAVRSAAQPIVSAAAPAVQAVKTAASNVAGRARAAVGGAEAPAATGGRGSAGAAATELASQRRATAETLGIELTEGQATREHGQLQFEKETAKDAKLGAPLRERADQQNQQLQHKLEEWIDGTGGAALDNVQTGRAVVDTLTKMKAAEKNKVRALYKQAEKAGDMEAPVETTQLIDFLNEHKVGETTAPVLKVARDELVRLGGAVVGDDGLLIPKAIDLNKLEAVRKAVNKFTKQEAPDMAMASGIRSTLDGMTEGAGGKAYQAARAARIELARKFENRAVVADLLANRKRMQDPKVAAENVFDRVVLKGSQDDVNTMAQVLRAGGEEGAQAWNELRGATVRYLRDEALSNSATDQAGNTIFSHPKYSAAVKKLDQNGRLDLVLGKKEAQGIRDLGEVASVVLTTPPGTVNHSNTASVLLRALTEAGVAGSLTGLPVPVLSGIKAMTNGLKDRKLAARVRAALGSDKKETTKF